MLSHGHFSMINVQTVDFRDEDLYNLLETKFSISEIQYLLLKKPLLYRIC